MIKKFVKDELYGWKKWEVGWLFFACIVIAVLSIYWGDTLIGVTSALTGVACVVCTGKGKLSAFLFGGVNTLLYAYISYQAKYYGEVMLNVLYFFPMQFYGFYIWRKNIDDSSKEVRKRKMSVKSMFFLFGCVLLLTVLYGAVLQGLGGELPFIDAFSTVVSVVAMIVSIKMYSEQWLLWIGVNCVTIFMWGYAFFINGSESVATLIMWTVYLVNAIIMCRKWYKESAENEER